MHHNSELDALDKQAAEKIMGYKLVGNLYHIDGKVMFARKLQTSVWRPTRNISQAWELLEKAAKHFAVIVWETDPVLYRCAIGTPREHRINIDSTAETAPLAITLACLEAVDNK